MDAIKTIANEYRLEFWKQLSQWPELSLQMDRFLNSKAIPPGLWEDFKIETYTICASKYHAFDPGLSSFNTWVVEWLKAVVKNYFRGSQNRNPGPDIRSTTESEFFDRDPAGESVLERIPDAKNQDQDLVLAVRQVIVSYGKSVAAYPHHRAAFNLLLNSGFDISSREMAAQMGVSHTWANRILKEVLAELGTMLIHLGIDKHSQTG